MKRLAGRQTRWVYGVEGRSGTLWEGRFKSSPIESNRYLLACCRYVEMNPVAAGLCDDPADYPWSSCRSKVQTSLYEWLAFDPLYLALGDNQEERRRRYQEFLAGSVSEEESETIRKAVKRGQSTGGASFCRRDRGPTEHADRIAWPGTAAKRSKIDLSPFPRIGTGGKGAEGEGGFSGLPIAGKRGRLRHFAPENLILRPKSGSFFEKSKMKTDV